jgi:hypothetical protein
VRTSNNMVFSLVTVIVKVGVRVGIRDQISGQSKFKTPPGNSAHFNVV